MTIRLMNWVRDVDISGDGLVSLNDLTLIINRYNNVTRDSIFNSAYDLMMMGS